MRKFLMAAAMLGIAHGAQAADMPGLPFLRGGFTDAPPRTVNWEGWYAGGQFGYSAAALDLSNATKSLTNYITRNSVLQAPISEWSLLEQKNASGTGFGAFVGRNWQWEDVVIGLELNYSMVHGLKGSSSGSMAREINSGDSTPPPNTTYLYNAALAGAATAEIKDIMTLRARVGWDAGTFMPYMFGGVALGRINVSRSANLGVTRREIYTDPFSGAVTVSGPFNVTLSPGSMAESGVDTITGGYTVGLGTEMNLVGGLFLRAEWEYAKFLKVKDVTASTNSARAGIGYKF